jgi:hypothetical protein
MVAEVAPERSEDARFHCPERGKSISTTRAAAASAIIN